MSNEFNEKYARKIRDELKMWNWTEFYRNGDRLIAQCHPSKEFWQAWRDGVNMEVLSLQPTKRGGRWIVDCWSPALAQMLIDANK